MVKKLHDAGWKNCYFTYAGVSMVGCGCGVSNHPRFYYQDLDKYQVLPRPYLGCFGGFPGEKKLRKWALDLAGQVKICFWEGI